MASVLKNASTNYAGPLPSYGWSPEVVLPEIRRLLRENTFLRYITTDPPGGQNALRHKGSKLIITLEADVKSLPFIGGKPLITQQPKSRDIEFEPKRMRYVQVGSTALQRYFSRHGDPRALFMDSGASDQVIQEQKEYFAFHLSKVPVLNTGAVVSLPDGPQRGYAGAVSGAYLIGSPERPVALYKSQSALDADSGATCPKAVGVDLISETESVLNENPLRTDNIKGLDFVEQASYNDRFYVGPEWVTKLAQLSEKVIDASPDASNYFFRNIGELDGKIGGYNRGFRSNLITPHICSGIAGGNAPAGTRSWPLFFGRKSAVAFAREFTENESNIKSQQVEGTVDRTIWLYDFYAMYPVYMGVAWVTPQAYTPTSD